MPTRTSLKTIKPLKRSKTGLETEFHLIDSEGSISHKVSDVLKKIKKEKDGALVMKEMGKSMIEFGSYPDVRTYNTMLDMIDSIQKTIDLCGSEGLKLYPFSTYPGKFEPHIRKGRSYTIQRKIFGDDIAKIFARVVGFHCHYTLPKSVFDYRTRSLRVLRKSKLNLSMVSSYNFEIAIDPILTAITQSSPFYEGKNIAKDSRMLVYRGGKKLGYMDAAYAKHQQFGGLPPYKMTATDLMNSFARRWQRWRRLVKRADPKADFEMLYPYLLDISWHPVKINKLGTLEQRGMDVNYLSILAAVTALIKFSLKKIQRDFIICSPTDFGLREAFKIEGNVMYLPPHSTVRNRLQRHSAYKGFESPALLDYTKRFLNFAKSVTPKRYMKLIRVVDDMIESKKTMSDRIIQYAKYKGYCTDGSISNPDARSLALYYADQLPKDLDKTRKMIVHLTSL